MFIKALKKFEQLFFSPIKYAERLGVEMGSGCSIMTKKFGSEPYLIKLGNHVQVTNGVTFFIHGGAWVLRKKYPKIDFFGKIIIGNNVYIGNNALILPGVSIGNDVIIGAGSVVTKSIPDGVIVGGNPAKIIGKIADFEEKMKKYDLESKGLNSDQKKNFLLNQPDEMFIKK